MASVMPNVKINEASIFCTITLVLLNRGKIHDDNVQQMH